MEYAVFATEWGYMGMRNSPKGLYQLTLPSETAEQAWRELGEVRRSTFSTPKGVIRMAGQIEEYFEGKRKSFDIALDWEGYTDFQREVLQYICSIPYAYPITYGDVAKGINKPLAARAVGQALHINRTPIVVPCHRVIAAGRKLGGFGGGLKYKLKLLALEQVDYKHGKLVL